MNLTRWKLLAGVFGLSVCGIAALAEPACRTVGPVNERQNPGSADAKPKGSTEPKAKVEPVPEAPKPTETAPVPAVIPLIPAASEPKAVVGVSSPAEIHGTPLLPVPSPIVPAQAPALPAEPAPTPLPSYTGPLITPQQFANDLATPPAPLKPQPVVNVAPLVDVRPSASPIPIEIGSQPAPLHPVVEPVRTVEHAPIPATSTVNAVVAAEKKLKVILQMDEHNPKFEVRDGEEIVLKVVSEKVDVTSPKNKGELWSTLKASGQVKFMTPGGDGFCDTLQVVPGTGEVIAIGNVKFTYNWGKVETSATSEKMTFRLGTQPTATR